jgi:tetratricopeptide (TPR) repeat protein
MGRALCVALGGALLALGLLALAAWQLPAQPLVAGAMDGLVGAADRLVGLAGVLPADAASRLQGALASGAARFGLAPLGAVLVLVALLPGRSGAPPRDPEPEAAVGYLAPTDKKADRKARKDAAALARRGDPLAAGELCLRHGLLDAAADHFLAADEPARAAEIRQSQNRLSEAAELFLKAGRGETAASIFAGEGAWQRAAEAYLDAGDPTVAAEMFEKNEDWRRAAECWERAEFPREAARCWARCSQWGRSGACLERVARELQGAAGHRDARREAEIQKLVRRAGDLYGRAGLEDKAEAVLAFGGCAAEAADVALRAGRAERAAELLLKGGDVARAAEVLRGLGRDEEAARLLGEWHRDRGEENEAARCFEEAGEHMAAGDLYRLLERFAEAGACYERQGEFAQAAEMFHTGGDLLRAADNYERAGCYAEAAQCVASSGQPEREAELLSRAGHHLRAAEILRRDGRDDDAITVLQKVDSAQADFAKAAALLGEIFRERGMHSLAVKKLAQALGGRELDRETVDGFYVLATVHEAAGNLREAAELYEKILAFDYHHADVAERLARTKQTVQRPAAGSATGTAPHGARYRILGKLGRGGMGIVYKAHDTVLDRPVAFKVLPDALKENPQALKNFLREAKNAAQLNHPNIVTVYDAGEQGGNYYIAMEYVDGHTLKDIVKHRGRIAPGGIVHVLGQLCEALAYAHDKKIVHRDVKTANAMWTRDRKAKIMDFGLARVVEEVRNHTTVVSGTPYYMSPEQTLGKNVDHRTDIYSLGVTVFELATGTLPFREGNLPYHHVHTPPPDPRERVPDLPDTIAAIILRCLRKDPADRYASVREILAELRAGSRRSPAPAGGAPRRDPA